MAKQHKAWVLKPAKTSKSSDVTVKAVDASSRSITITKSSKTKSKDIELEVGKKAKR